MPKIHEVITEETWGKGLLDLQGERHCSLGWILIIYVTQDGRDLARTLLLSVIDDFSVIKWNDAPERTFAEVLEALKKADV